LLLLPGLVWLTSRHCDLNRVLYLALVLFLRCSIPSRLTTSSASLSKTSTPASLHFWRQLTQFSCSKYLPRVC
ncbi:hypothetical protein GGI09_006526, partial [Coemansia sp. S100]